MTKADQNHHYHKEPGVIKQWAERKPKNQLFPIMVHQNDLESVLEMQNPILHSSSPMQNPILQSQISIPKYAELIDDLYVLESLFFF